MAEPTDPDSEGALHDRIAQAMDVAIADIDRGTAAVLPTVWLIVRDVTAVTGAANVASRRLLEALGFHLAGRLPDTAEVRYTLSFR